MLQRIKVKNYAIIDELTIDFNPHFNIITGETGAGKSILLGALGLILGNRADSKTFFNKEEKCIVEAEFQIREYEMQQWFSENDLDYEDLTIIRREIQPAGKNRVFINDTPVTLQQLQDLTQQLVDIHQQFSLYDIQKPAYQLTLFDAYAGNKTLSADYSDKYKRLNHLNRDLKELEEKKIRSIQESDYITFQLNELNAVVFESMDQEAMEGELNMIEYAETIRTTAGAAYLALYEEEQNIISALDGIISRFSPIAKVSGTISEIYERLHSVKIELQELSSDINHLSESTEIDEERAASIKENLDQLYKLQSKHQLKDIQSLIELKKDLESRLQNFDELDNTITSLQSEIKTLEKELFGLADKLSIARKTNAKPFTDTLHKLLGELGMPHAQFVVEINKAEKLSPSGTDQLQFLFAANKGSVPAPIKDVASGGEISRLTLSVKSLVAAAIPLPSLIFDEIDTGLGGEIAVKMASILKNMAKDHQLIAITHSPQLASKANKHLFVYKEIIGDKTYTQIKELSLEERIENIAIMLSTKPPSKAAIENAKELIA